MGHRWDDGSDRLRGADPGWPYGFTVDPGGSSRRGDPHLHVGNLLAQAADLVQVGRELAEHAAGGVEAEVRQTAHAVALAHLPHVIGRAVRLRSEARVIVLEARLRSGCLGRWKNGRTQEWTRTLITPALDLCSYGQFKILTSSTPFSLVINGENEPRRRCLAIIADRCHHFEVRSMSMSA